VNPQDGPQEKFRGSNDWSHRRGFH